MKVLAVVDAFPPESDAETARLVRASCLALSRSGVVVTVVAGTRANDGRVTRSIDAEGGFPIQRVSRADLHPDHWHKSSSSTLGDTFRAILRAEDPDVVHVHHWRRLSRDLVRLAALEQKPAVASLHDAWTSCLIGTRVLPDTRDDCEVPLAAFPCLGCAQSVPPKTPWVPLEAQFMALAERQRDLARELELARTVLVRSRARGDALKRWLGDSAAKIDLCVHDDDDPDHVRRSIELYERAIQSGAPSAAAGADDWFSARMRAFAESEWDERMRAHEREGQRA